MTFVKYICYPQSCVRSNQGPEQLACQDQAADRWRSWDLSPEPMAPKQCALTHLTVSFHRALQGASFLIQNLGEMGYYESKNVTLRRWQMLMELRNLVPPEVLPTPTEDHLALSTGSA